jgi:hypothetical protein
MDVQATSSVATILPAVFQQLTATQPASGGSAPVPPSVSFPAAPSPVAPAPASSADSGSHTDGGANSSIGATPGLATLPAGPPAGSKKGADDPTLASGIAKLYNAQEQNVTVSFQIEQNPNEIVTVFTDKHTGKVIVQFPSETLIALAKFFDKLNGSVVNKKV